jgi:hypothetical protein
MVGKCPRKGNARLGTITWVKNAEGAGAGPCWQGRRAPVLGRRRGLERGAFEVVGPRGAVADAGAADGGGGRRPRRERGALEGVGASRVAGGVNRLERATSQGAAGVHPAGAAATGACRSRHPLAMVEPTDQQIRRRRGSRRRVAPRRRLGCRMWRRGSPSRDCAPLSTPRMEPMHRCPPGDLGRTCAAAAPGGTCLWRGGLRPPAPPCPR